MDTVTQVTGRHWITRLTPGSLATTLRLPDGGTVEHLRLRWVDADPAGLALGEPTVTAVPPFDLVRSDATAADGSTVARLEMTVRHGDAQPPTGIPECPTLPRSQHSRRFVVCAEEVDQHLDEVQSVLVTPPARATRDGGMPLPLVPTTLLVQIVAAPALSRSAGEVEGWFLQTVPVGALVLTCEHPDGLIDLRLAGRDDSAVILRVAASAAT
ncbi:MAG TPA: hypothetical protein VFI47_00395 [Acidimicrobiales bacterium]|nr:hypothetical protein [Acidimicrobiales bacterium]